jgi:hypothetical protein
MVLTVTYTLILRPIYSTAINDVCLTTGITHPQGLASQATYNQRLMKFIELIENTFNQ